MLPDDLTIIRELASVHVLQRNISSAAQLYEAILHDSQNPQATIATASTSRVTKSRVSSSQTTPKFGWSELNILSELYGAQNEWLKAIQLIKTTARWLTQRSDERFWNDVAEDNDDEFDPERAPLNRHFPRSKIGDPEALKAYTLPLDLRAKMIVYRLKLGHLQTALSHATFILAEAEKEPDIGPDGRETRRYADLFLDVAEALAEAEQYDQALSLYVPLEEIEEYATPQLVMSMGKCLHGLGDFEQAETAYQTVIDSDVANLDARIALAEVYEATGKRREALQLVTDVMRIRRENEREKTVVGARSATEELQQQSQPEDERKETNSSGEVVPSFIPNTEGHRTGRPGRRPNPTSRAKVTRSERIEAEAQAAITVQAKLKRLRQYQEGLRKGNPVAVAEWLQAASELVDMFTNIKAFFPSDKQKVFKGFFVITKKRAGRQTINDKLKGMASRLQESLNQAPTVDDGQDDGDQASEHATEFRGVSFDDWFGIFMQYALTLTWHEEVEDAYSVLKRAKDANVFFQDKDKVRVMNLVHLSCCLHVGDYQLAVDIVRTMITNQEKLFNPNMYRLLLCCVPGGKTSLDAFNYNGIQKYMLRQVKGLDSVVQGKAITGSINVAHAEASEEREGPILLTIYGQILAASRSYVPSLSYYMRAFAIAPEDPMVLFSTGLAHLHRALQRQSNNRHLQIVQGLSYLIDYYRTRTVATKGTSSSWVEEQEVNYNLGRAFQMLGLPSLSIKYYERVLQLNPSKNKEAQIYNMQLDAAYNLQMLYVMSGNSKLAKMIVDKYLVL